MLETVIYRAPKSPYIELPDSLKEADGSYLQGLRNHKLELVKSEVSQEAPPSFLTKTPLGQPLEPAKNQSILHNEPSAHKKRPPKKNQQAPWLSQELSFTMNKMSLAGMVFGLMVLGTLFFVIGFLAAVATLGPTPQATQHNSWATVNGPTGAGAAGGGLVGRIAGKLIHDEAIKLESKVGGGVLGGAITQHVPPALQPFAQQAQNKFAMAAQQNINRAANPMITGVRGPSRIAPQPAAIPTSPFAPHPTNQPSLQQGYPMAGPYQSVPPQPYAPPPNYGPPAPRGYNPPPPGYGMPAPGYRQ